MGKIHNRIVQENTSDWFLICFIYYCLGYAYNYSIYLDLYLVEILNNYNDEEQQGMYDLI